MLRRKLRDHMMQAIKVPLPSSVEWVCQGWGGNQPQRMRLPRFTGIYATLHKTRARAVEIATSKHSAEVSMQGKSGYFVTPERGGLETKFRWCSSSPCVHGIVSCRRAAYILLYHWITVQTVQSIVDVSSVAGGEEGCHVVDFSAFDFRNMKAYDPRYHFTIARNLLGEKKAVSKKTPTVENSDEPKFAMFKEN